MLTLRYYTTGTFQEACGDQCDISQLTASRIIKRVSEAIVRLKIHYKQFPTAVMLPQIKLDFWRICAFPNVVGTIDCTHIKNPCPGGENAELFRNREGFSLNVQQCKQCPPKSRNTKHCCTVAGCQQCRVQLTELK